MFAPATFHLFAFIMKPLPTLLFAALLGGASLAAAPAAQAQVTININPPSWGPAVPQGAQYYYIPETNGFYDVPARQYVVLRDGRWMRVGTWRAIIWLISTLWWSITSALSPGYATRSTR